MTEDDPSTIDANLRRLIETLEADTHARGWDTEAPALFVVTREMSLFSAPLWDGRRDAPDILHAMTVGAERNHPMMAPMIDLMRNVRPRVFGMICEAYADTAGWTAEERRSLYGTADISAMPTREERRLVMALIDGQSWSYYRTRSTDALEWFPWGRADRDGAGDLLIRLARVAGIETVDA